MFGERKIVEAFRSETCLQESHTVAELEDKRLRAFRGGVDGSSPSAPVSSFKMAGAGVVAGTEGVRVGGGAITGVATFDTAGRPCSALMGQAKPNAFTDQKEDEDKTLRICLIQRI